MGFVSDFKAFIMRGNVLDLAVGVIIGGAFGGIVTSLVNDILMPPIGALTKGAKNFKDLFVSLDGHAYASLDDARKASAPIIVYGNFINTVINFLIIAFVIFILVRQISKLFPPPPAPPPPGPTAQEKLLAEIRDLLAKGSTPPLVRP